ncbi:translation initiation factor IF-2-like [Neovison vison]|uniref:translation initiation factor IF-2-like n=1 Tax=Neovison vison TaxID=452646 RepID=UPI001CF07CB2|nr:translation initiation factor IF-2-like [Neogale vison]
MGGAAPTSLSGAALAAGVLRAANQGQIFGSRQAGQDKEKREEHVVISTYNSISQNILFSERGCEKAMAVIYPPPTAQAPHYLRASLISGPREGRCRVSQEYLTLKSRSRGETPDPRTQSQSAAAASEQLPGRPVAKVALGRPEERDAVQGKGAEERERGGGGGGGGGSWLLALPRARAAADGADAADRAGRGAARSPGRSGDELAAARPEPPPSARRSAAAPATASQLASPAPAPPSPASEPKGARLKPRPVFQPAREGPIQPHSPPPSISGRPHLRELQIGVKSPTSRRVLQQPRERPSADQQRRPVAKRPHCSAGPARGGSARIGSWTQARTHAARRARRLLPPTPGETPGLKGLFFT